MRNSNHVKVNVIGSNYATKLITTDPNLLHKSLKKWRPMEVY